MKILQVIPFFSPKFGGSVTVPFELSKELAKRGHQITLITTDFRFDQEYAGLLEVYGIKVIKFPCILNFGLFLYSPRINQWLKKNITQFDVIHLHNFRSYQNSCVVNQAIKNNIPYILQAHGSITPLFQKRRLKTLYDYFHGNHLLKHLSLSIAITEKESKDYQKMGIRKEKIIVIPNGTFLPEFINFTKKDLFRDKYGIKKNGKCILYIGRLHQTKGLDLLLDAFFEMNKLDNNINLILIGPNDGYLDKLLDNIERYNLQNKVFIIGYISNEEKIQAYIAADVFVTPSYSGFPVTFLEALSFGLPIVTTNNGDNLDWIHNNVGQVVNYDAVSLANGIKKILQDRELYRRYSYMGKRLIMEQFCWSKITGDFEVAYEKVRSSL